MRSYKLSRRRIVCRLCGKNKQCFDIMVDITVDTNVHITFKHKAQILLNSKNIFEKSLNIYFIKKLNIFKNKVKEKLSKLL